MVIPLNNKKHIAFVASGGGPKALFYHVGFSAALREKGINLSDIKTFIGSSAGSIFAAIVGGGFSLDEMIDAFTKEDSRLKKLRYFDLITFNRDLISDYIKGLMHNNFGFTGIESLISNLLRFNSPLSTDGIENYIKEILPVNEFWKLEKDVFITGTRLNPTKEIYKDVVCKKDFYNGDFETKYRSDVSIPDAVAASCALPGLLAPKRIKTSDEGFVDYIDGEVRKTLSTHIAKDNNADLILVSYTHEPYHLMDGIGSLKKYGMYANVVQSVFIGVSQKIKNAKFIHETKKDAIDSVYRFARRKGLPKKLTDELIEQLSKDIGFNRSIKYIFSHPTDPEFFMEANFNMAGDCAKRIIEYGYNQGLKDLKELNKQAYKEEAA